MQRANEANAEEARRQAELAIEAAKHEESTFRETAARLMASQRAAAAANGVALTGSPMEVMRQTALDVELDAATIRWQGDNEAQAFLSQERQDLMAAGHAFDVNMAARARGEREAELFRKYGKTNAEVALRTGEVVASGAKAVGRAKATASLLSGASRIATFSNSADFGG